MCDPLTVGTASVGLAGALAKGQAQAERGRAAKSAADLNATIEEKAAADAVERGQLKDLQVAMHASAIEADQAVTQSGSGAAVGVGAPLQTRMASQAVSEIDRAIVRRNAAMEAYGLRGRARAIRQEGENERAAGENARLGTFLSGIGSFAGQTGKLAIDYVGKNSADIEE